MISNYLFVISIFSTLSCSLLLIYNIVIYINKKFNYVNFTNESSKKFRKKLIYLLSIIVINFSYIYIYSRPISIYELAKLDNNNQVMSIRLRGDFNTEDSITLDQIASQDYIDFLNQYRYKRTFNFSNIGGKVTLVTFEYAGYKNIYIEIWGNRYIRIPNNKVYRIVSKDNSRENFNERLKNKINYLY